MGNLSGFLRSPWSLLGPLGANLGQHGAKTSSWLIFSPPLGAQKLRLAEAPCNFLVASNASRHIAALLRRSWAYLGSSWAHLGAKLAILRLQVGHLSPILAPSSAILADLGLKLRPSWQDVSTKMPKMSYDRRTWVQNGLLKASKNGRYGAAVGV